MLYHISAEAGLRQLQPRRSAHGTAYVYAAKNLTTGLLFGAAHDDFDFIIDEENGIPSVSECWPGAFEAVFQGKSCSVYEVSEEGFCAGATGWDAELVSERAVSVRRELAVPDLYRSLLDAAAEGRLNLRRYRHTDAYRKKIAGHVLDRLIRFDVLARPAERRLEEHFGPLLDGLRVLMEGRLLP